MAVALAVFVAAEALTAKEGATAGSSPQDDTGRSPATADAPAAQIDGFRSARFGTGEEKLLPIIAKDLGVEAKSIRVENNPTDRTRALVATANNVLPDSGQATVAYILGATSKQLMQVNVVWAAAVKDSAGLERLTATANILRDFFLRKGGYVKSSLAANAKLPDGSVLVFRGGDDKGRLIVLHMVVTPAPAGGDKAAEGGNASLMLSYIEKPGAPDVFRLPPTSF